MEEKVFGFCHVYLDPPGDLVLAVHRQSTYLNHGGGSAQIFSLTTAADKAEAFIPCLLDAFMSQQPDNLPRFAPWTWSTLDPDIAQAVQEGLRNHGVKPELCQVGVCSVEERQTLESARARFFEKLESMQTWPRPRFATVEPGDTTKCHGCGMSRECFFQPLKKCSRCSSAFYHSRDCQKAHWKHHKPTCSPAANNAPDPDAFAYYNTKAPTDPDARALMCSLRLEPHPARVGMRLPLQRLVLTGQDTPKNMQLLFGPQWDSSIKKNHEDVRIEYLLDPPPGSPHYAMYAHAHDASVVRSLRPATEAERQRVNEVREMQDLIRRKVGVGNSPSSADMMAILTAFGAASRARMMTTYSLAVNAMDQGVPAGRNRG